MMKIILSVGILFLVFPNIFAVKTITCKARTTCLFSGVSIKENEVVALETDPANADVNTIDWVTISDSSVYSVPAEVFKKFPNLTWLWASGLYIKEIKPGTFLDAKKLEDIQLHNNALTFLHVDTFKGTFPNQFPISHVVNQFPII
jgi:hypothetical protein